MATLREQLQDLSNAVIEALHEDPMDVDRVRAVLACCESVKAAYSEGFSNEGGSVDFLKILEGVDYQKITGHNNAVARVFQAWAKRQAAPDRCRLGDASRRMIRSALRDASEGDLLTLIDYAYDADAPGPRYWRGENEMKRTYLGLDNLLVAKKLAGRVQDATAWRVKKDAPAVPLGPPRAELGAMGSFRRRQS